jgi:ComF family protein
MSNNTIKNRGLFSRIPLTKTTTLTSWLQIIHRVSQHLLPPQNCLICDANAGHNSVCSACANDLPTLPQQRCPQCAQPVQQAGHCGHCLKTNPHYAATIALWAYDFPIDRLIQRLKYRQQLPVARLFSSALRENIAHLPKDIDLILPVPLSAARIKERGFNQAVEFARPLARQLKLPLELHALQRTTHTVPQASLPWKERHKNIRNAFACSVDFTGKHILVVDDVMTTGATLNEIARVLKNHGASRVTNCVLARAVRG